MSETLKKMPPVTLEVNYEKDFDRVIIKLIPINNKENSCDIRVLDFAARLPWTWKETSRLAYKFIGRLMETCYRCSLVTVAGIHQYDSGADAIEFKSKITVCAKVPDNSKYVRFDIPVSEIKSFEDLIAFLKSICTIASTACNEALNKEPQVHTETYNF